MNLGRAGNNRFGMGIDSLRPFKRAGSGINGMKTSRQITEVNDTIVVGRAGARRNAAVVFPDFLAGAGVDSVLLAVPRSEIDDAIHNNRLARDVSAGLENPLRLQS